MAKSKKTAGASAGGGRIGKVAKVGSVKAGRAAAASAGAASAPGPTGGARKTYLTRGELAEFRRMLLEKRRTLVGDLNGMEESATKQAGSGNLSNMPTHMADVGTDTFEHEFTLGLLESEQALLSEINKALGRIEAGTYGICLGTGEQIPKARLRAKPWAKYTVEYARQVEQRLVVPPGEEEEQ